MGWGEGKLDGLALLDPLIPTFSRGEKEKDAVASCRAVAERAAKMFEWRVPGDSLLDIALDHLTLGRAALYSAILEGCAPFPQRQGGPPPTPASEAFATARRELDEAVAGLRRAGQQQYLPLGLLTRAWLYYLDGQPAHVQEILDEAWDIAARGPMPLFLADLHLHRARLFFREQPYPWNKSSDGAPRGPQDDLAAASSRNTATGGARKSWRMRSG